MGFGLESHLSSDGKHKVKKLAALLLLLIASTVVDAAGVVVIDGVRYVEPTGGDTCNEFAYADTILKNRKTGKEWYCDEDQLTPIWAEVPISLSIINREYQCAEFATSGVGTEADPFIGWDDAETGCITAAQLCAAASSVHNNCKAVFSQGWFKCTATDCLGKQKAISSAVDGLVFEGSGTGSTFIVGNYSGSADFYFIDGCTAADVVAAAMPMPDNADPPGGVVSGGTFTDDNRAEFEVAISSAGTPDDFRWRKRTRGVTGIGSWSSPVAVTGSAQTLSDGVTVDFEFTTGHAVNDVWRIEAGFCDPSSGTNDYKDVTFKHLAFVGANPSTADGGGLVTQIPTNAYGFRVFSTGQAQSWRWESSKLAMLYGGVSFNGTGTASENKFIGSEIVKIGPFGYAFEWNNAQAVNHEFIGTDVEGIYGNAFQFGPEGGGNVHVFGGSWILNDPESPYRPKEGYCTDDVFTSCTTDIECADEITTADGAGSSTTTLTVNDADSLAVGDWIFVGAAATEGRRVVEKNSSTSYELSWTGIGVTDEVSYSDSESILGGAQCVANHTAFIWAMSGGGPSRGSSSTISFTAAGFEVRLDSLLMWVPTSLSNVTVRASFNDCHFVNSNTDPKEWVTIGAFQQARFNNSTIRENGAPMFYRLTGEATSSNTGTMQGWIIFRDSSVTPFENRIDERVIFDDANRAFGRVTVDGMYGAEPAANDLSDLNRAGYSMDLSSRKTGTGVTDTYTYGMVLAGETDGWPGYDTSEPDDYKLERNLTLPLGFTIIEIDCYKPTGTGTDEYVFRVGTEDEAEIYCESHRATRASEFWMQCHDKLELDTEEKRTVRLWAETALNTSCTASDDPWDCCTGAGAGTCAPVDPAGTAGQGHCIIRGY
ncbi:MAG: hypothetical protein GY715_14285 [Planctomycetes bacterium]|nr:hypothetical protein [Planctomycetota bacterium]